MSPKDKSTEEVFVAVGEVISLPASPLTAKPDAPDGNLVVKVSSRFPWRGQMPTAIEEELPDPKPYEEPVEVTIELTDPKDGTSTFGDSKYTLKGEGEVSWDQIPAGDYTITVSFPDGFTMSGYTIDDDDEVGTWTPANTPPLIVATVEDEDTTTVEVFLLPLLSAVDVFPFYDKNRSGNPAGQVPITGLRASFRFQGNPLVAVPFEKSKHKDTARTTEVARAEKALGKGVQHLIGPSLTQTLHGLDHDLTSVHLIWKRGTVSVFTDSAVMAGNLALQVESKEGTFVSLKPGSLVRANIPYEESQAEIQVAAFLQEDLVCDPCCAPSSGRPSTKRTPLPNVTFQLYLGSAQGEPYQQATTSGSAPHVFSNLPAGTYTVTATTWPTTFAGRNQIQPIWPPRGTLWPLSVSAGVPATVEFCFAPCLSKVIGIVTEGQAGSGIAGVPLTLAPSGGNDGTDYQTTSDATGEYDFENVTAGNYVVRIEREKITLPNGRILEVPAPAQAGYAISVPSCGTISAPVIQLDEDIHKVFGTATAPDGSVLQFLRVEIQDKSGRPVAITQTDANGYYECLLPQAGFYLVVPQINQAPQIPVQINSEQQVNIMVAPGGSPSSQQAASRAAQVTESEIDLQAYPVLTEEVPSEIVSRPPSSGAGSGIAPIGKMAESAIRDVLSWRTKVNDPKSFMLALNQSFALKDVEGHTEFTWTPRTYTVQTDMGAITGAQASIYNRAKVALDQSLPLLDGLYALLPALEQEDLDSVREMVRSLFTELVNDFGIEGGPRVPRVDQLFTLLLGHPFPTDPEKANGQLGTIRERFGLKREFVTTIPDEQNLTNYIILVDYVIGLRNSWQSQKAYFARSGPGNAEPFFGTQLVLLSRALDVVAQSVKDVYFAMDSVFLSAAERQTLLLDFTSLGEEGEASLFVAELLDWVERAASEELPAQLQDSGKDAIGTMKHVVQKLHKFVRAAILPHQPLKGLPPGYRTPRVQRALRELSDQLGETYKLAEKIRTPDFPPEIPAPRRQKP
jgi:hypothetical protein